MINISIPYIYELGAALRPLGSLEVGKPIGDHFIALISAEWQLGEFLSNSVYAPVLRAARQPGTNLLQAIKKLTTAPDQQKNLDFLDIHSVRNALSQFEAVLTAELNVTSAYLVTNKRGYDTVALIGDASVLFPAELVEKVPGAIGDIQQAGKCIAFELPTAAGFHLHRANESVLHRYYDAVSGGAARPKNNNVGDYLAEMTKNKWGDAIVLASLRDLKDLHRNPLIHPQDSLESVDEAIGLMGSVHAVIVHMLKAIPFQSPAPALVASNP